MKPARFSINITNVLFLFTIMSGIGRMFLENDIFLILYAVFSFLIILNELKHFKLIAPLFLLIVLMFLVILILWLKMIMGLNYSLNILQHFIVGSCLAHAIFRGGINKRTALIIFYLITGYFIFNIFFLNVSVDELELIENKRNSISVLVISCFIILIFLYRQNKVVMPIIPAFIYVIVSIWAQGRSGIITSLIIFLAMVFAPESSRLTMKKKMVIFFTMATVTVVIIFIYFDEIMTMANTLMPYLIAKGLADDERSYIILSYIQKINTFSFIFGVDLERIHFLTQFNYNPHNSYIKLHTVVGIVSFLFYIPVAYHVVRELIDRHVVYVVCVLAYLLRIGTDSIVGSNVLSFVFLTITLLGLDSLIKDVKFLQRNKSAPDSMSMDPNYV